MLAQKIGLIVEADGEYHAASNLLTRVLIHLKRHDVYPGLIQNSGGRGKLTRQNGLERFVGRAYREPNNVALLVLLDSEGECPRTLAAGLARRIRDFGAQYPTAVVLPHRMYEAWFVACAPALSGKEVRGRLAFKADLRGPDHPESVPDPKAWLEKHMPAARPYKETEDMLLLTRSLDIPMAATRSRSFRRLLHAVEELVAAMDASQTIVTPRGNS